MKDAYYYLQAAKECLDKADNAGALSFVREAELQINRLVPYADKECEKCGSGELEEMPVIFKNEDNVPALVCQVCGYAERITTNND